MHIADQKSASTARLVVISGCSGGGKTSLLAELERRGYPIIEEPGRRVIAAERLRRSGRPSPALPWTDMAAFAMRAIDLARADRQWARTASGIIFFDRGLVDAAAALEHQTGRPIIAALSDLRYDSQVFMAPPWPEIFVNDADRRHDFAEAEAEYQRLLRAYARLGYSVAVLPKISVTDRADFVIAALKA